MIIFSNTEKLKQKKNSWSILLSPGPWRSEPCSLPSASGFYCITSFVSAGPAWPVSSPRSVNLTVSLIQHWGWAAGSHPLSFLKRRVGCGEGQGERLGWGPPLWQPEPWSPLSNSFPPEFFLSASSVAASSLKGFVLMTAHYFQDRTQMRYLSKVLVISLLGPL